MRVGKIVIGSANFGSTLYGIKNKRNVSNKSIKEILSFAKKIGIKEIDTSIEYTGVYKNLKKCNLKSFNISSKFVLNNQNNKNFLISFHNSLKDLGVKKYENFLFHNLNDIYNKNFDNVLDKLNFLKKKKFIKRIGISLNDPKEIYIVKKKFVPDIVQLPFNILDRRILNKKYLNSFKNIKIQIRSIFLQGLLIMDYKKIRADRYSKKILNDLNKWTKLNSSSNFNTCINFIKNFNFYDSCVVGVNSKTQLKKFVTQINNKEKYYPTNIFSNKKKLIEPRKWKK